MKTIEIDDELYHYIASKTEFIGESASDILRRLLTANAELSAPSVKSEPVEKRAQMPVNDAVESEQEASPTIEQPAPAEQVTETKDLTSCQNIFDLINREELAMERGAVGRFLNILGNLHRVHPKQFSAVLDIRGRDRLYFAESEEELLATGSSSKPKQIPDSNYWVITNSNTTKKKLMLTDVAHVLGYNNDQAESIRDFL
ncbi:replication initiation negative regulator SeqA [Thalassotalea mangrovi]|uniref:Negative modulator of initiation of replication n=1 Tax=Thalassotalea mangrovi TaxID=2572245 RepID=A0A4U1B5F1_9GAMM|nr:replication initiation negative regulator SeqA [Thalassotalea mangrovi]TKB45628.1 replication initiation negative regulator SeqA [Thalassotalea mangrovi]